MGSRTYREKEYPLELSESDRYDESPGAGVTNAISKGIRLRSREKGANGFLTLTNSIEDCKENSRSFRTLLCVLGVNRAADLQEKSAKFGFSVRPIR